MSDRLISSDLVTTYVTAYIGGESENLPIHKSDALRYNYLRRKIHDSNSEVTLSENLSRLFNMHKDGASLKSRRTALTKCADQALFLRKKGSETWYKSYGTYEDKTMYGLSYNDISTCESGNNGSYNILLKIMKSITFVPESRDRDLYELLGSFTSARIGLGSNLAMPSQQNLTFAMKLIRVYEELQELITSRTKAASHFEDIVKSEFDDLHKPRRKSSKVAHRTSKLLNNIIGIDLFTYANLAVFMTKQQTFLMTLTHLTRMMNFIAGVIALSLSSHAISPEINLQELVTGLLGVICEYNDFEVDEAPGSLKALRQYSIYKLDENNVLGVDGAAEYLKTLSTLRKEMFFQFKALFRQQGMKWVYIANWSNMFKAMLHPDCNIKEVFSAISGLTNPRGVKENAEDLIEARARRELYLSLKAQGYDARLTCDDADIDTLRAAVNKSNEPDTKTDYYENLPLNNWLKLKISEVKNGPKASHVKLKASSKKSAQSLDSTELLGKEKLEKMAESHKKTPTLKNRDDLIDYLMVDEQKALESSISRFERVIKAHERFEEQSGGIDKVTPEMLSSFLDENPDASYLVSTEPKFGEVHKVVTRLFYLGERDLKNITQAVERLVKQMIRRQEGVSITLDSRMRRKEVEFLARSSEGGGRTPLYVSFDMTEFSKRFPMGLVRRYGRPLSEITGEKWLRRIDLLFRAAQVLMSTRGGYHRISGILGGFEGFLNFLWTSIHALIMMEALSRTGVKGRLMTYSDDGILTIFFDDSISKEELHDIVRRIQEAYSSFGLDFHLSKTMVSSKVWEYLGTYGHDEKIINQYVKELSGLMSTSQQRKVELFLDKVELISSKVKSAVQGMTSFCPLTASHLATFFSSRIIKRRFPNIPNTVLLYMLIAPPRYCGFGIPSPLAIGVSSSLERDTFFVDEIETLRSYYPDVTTLACSLFTTYATKSDNPSRAIFNSTRVKLSIPDISGREVLSNLLDYIKDNCNIPFNVVDPLRGALGKVITNHLECIVNLRISDLSNLLRKIPEVVEYEEIMSYPKGQSALQLLSRRELAKAQGNDSRNINDAVNLLKDLLGEGKKTNFRKVFLASSRRSFPTLDFAELRSFSKCYSKGDDSIAIVNMDRSKHPQMYDYKEHVKVFSKATSTIKWIGEMSGSEKDRNRADFISSAAQFLGSNPEMGDLIDLIAAASGLDICIPAGIKSRETSRRIAYSDVELYVPSPFHNNIRVHLPSSDFTSMLERGEGTVDRTTIIAMTKLLAYCEASSKGLIYPTAKKEVHVLRRKVNELSNMMVIKSMTKDELTYLEKLESNPDALFMNRNIPQMSEQERREFSDEYLMSLRASIDQDALNQFEDFGRLPKETEARVVRDMLINRAVRSMYEFSDDKKGISRLLNPLSFPVGGILSTSIIVRYVLERMPPNLRGSLAAVLLRSSTMNEEVWKFKIMSLGEALEQENFLHTFDEFMKAMEDERSWADQMIEDDDNIIDGLSEIPNREDQTNIEIRTKILSRPQDTSSSIDYIPIGSHLRYNLGQSIEKAKLLLVSICPMLEKSDVNLGIKVFLYEARKQLVALSAFEDNRVFLYANPGSSKVCRATAKYFRWSITSSLADSRLEEVTPLFRACAKICREMIRPSQHRSKSHPFNSSAAEIMITHLYLSCGKYLNQDYVPNINELLQILHPSTKRKVMSGNHPDLKRYAEGLIPDEVRRVIRGAKGDIRAGKALSPDRRVSPRRMLSLINNSIISVLARQIDLRSKIDFQSYSQYPSPLHSMAVDAISLGLSTTSDGLFGSIKKFDDLSSTAEEYNMFPKLAYNLLQFEIGVSHANMQDIAGSDKDCLDAIASISEARVLGPYFTIRNETVEEIFSNLCLLSSYGGTLAAVERSDVGYTTYVATIRNLTLAEPGRPFELTILNRGGHSLDFLLQRCAVSRGITSSRSSTEPQTRTMVMHVPFVARALSSTGSSSFPSDHRLFQAKQIADSGVDPKTVTQCYFLFLCYLLDKDIQISKFNTACRNYLKRRGQRDLSWELNSVFMYLRQINIRSPSDLNLRRCFDLSMYASKVDVMIGEVTLRNIANLNPPDQVKLEMSDIVAELGGKSLVGWVSDLLSRRLEIEQEENDEEEEPNLLDD
jgi:hypothetical protein